MQNVSIKYLNTCHNKKENFISENSYKVRPFILEMDF
jgi:hypothetical protein